MIRWARRQKRRIGVRLVKGAYWDSEIAWAKQKGWPIPVFLDKAETDANYERLSRLLLGKPRRDRRRFRQPQLAQLGPRHRRRRRNSVCRPTATRSRCFTAWPSRCARRSFKTARRVRVYLPVGELLPGMSYLIRRLMENTSNTSFLRQTYAEQKDIGSFDQSAGSGRLKG